MDRKSPFHQDGASVVPCRDPGHGAGQSPAARRVWAMAEPQPGSALTCVFTSFFSFLYGLLLDCISTVNIHIILNSVGTFYGGKKQVWKCGLKHIPCNSTFFCCY